MRNCLILKRRGKGEKEREAFTLAEATGIQGGPAWWAAGGSDPMAAAAALGLGQLVLWRRSCPEACTE